MENNNDDEEVLRLIDYQQYLNSSSDEHEPRGLESTLNVSETRKRVEDEAAYQASVHKYAFRTSDDKNPDPRSKLLDAIDKEKIILRAANGAVETDLKPLATHCDTIFAFATSYQLYKDDEAPALEFCLDTYSLESVCAFVDAASGLKRPEDVPSDYIVECCQIAHYLQCNHVLNPIVPILIEAVDADNCKPLLELADRLSLPLLFERSLFQMMQSLEETLEVWDDLPFDLRDRVKLMKEALQSSILTRSSSRLYFSSLDEYLAMFQETLTYNRERLWNAKQRQEEECNKFHVRSRAWQYNQNLLDKQERRFRRLEQVMESQEMVFAKVDGAIKFKTRSTV